MLNLDPNKRPTLEEIQEDVWYKGNVPSEVEAKE